MSIEDVAGDYVHCTQCGACELRCPNTLFTGDFYRFRTRTVDLVKADARAGRGQRHPPAGLAGVEPAHGRRRHEPVLDGTPRPGARRRLGRGLGLPVGGETILFCDCEAAFHRTSLPRAVARMLRAAGVEFGLMREQWCCGGPAAEMGYAEQARRFAEHNVADWRAIGAKRIIVHRPARLHLLHRGLPALLRRRLRLRDRAGRRAGGRAGARRPAAPHRAGRPRGHVPRRLPAQQAQGHPRRAARDPARDPGPHLQGRRPRDPVVLLLRRGRRPRHRAARPHRRDQPAAAGAGRRPRGRHAGERLRLVRAPADRGRRRRGRSRSRCGPDGAGRPRSAGLDLGRQAEPTGDGARSRSPTRSSTSWSRSSGRRASSPACRRATTAPGCRRRSRCTAGGSTCRTSSCCPPAPSRSRRS